MNEDFRDYETAKEKHEILKDLVYHLDVISLQDSLQFLAQLPEAELFRAIDLLIQAEVKRERELLEEERSKQQLMYESNRNGGRGEQFGNNTSGGKWYFYNPATLSFGLSEFRKKWGKRKLEDDWRRKDKKMVSVFETDSIASDSLKLVTENKKDPNYYLEKLPKTQEAMFKSNEMIKESIYQAGTIYKNGLKEYGKSSALFMSLLSRFPDDKNYAAITYYNVYINHLELENIKEAEVMKSLLLHNFPNSVYAQLLTNPNFKDQLIDIQNEDELAYQLVYKLYQSGDYIQVIEKCNSAKSDMYESKYLFLQALSFSALDSSFKCMGVLNKIINTISDSSIVNEAVYLLEAIKNPEKMKKANEQALTESPYLFRSRNKHMSLFILPKEGVDINYLKTLISDYHSSDFENEIFEISAMLMGSEKHLLMIKTFDSSKDVVNYNSLIMKDGSVVNQLNKSEFKVLAISFENFKEFYKNKDVEGYYNFFKKNYLDNN
jgi:hypothetical protein